MSSKFAAAKAIKLAQKLFDILKINETYAVPEMRHYITDLEKALSFKSKGKTLGQLEKDRLKKVKATNDYIASVNKKLEKGTTPAELDKARIKLHAIMKIEYKVIEEFRKAAVDFLKKIKLSSEDMYAMRLIRNETVFARKELERIEKAFDELIDELLKKGGPRKNEKVQMVAVSRAIPLKYAKVEVDDFYIPANSNAGIKGRNK